MACIRRLPGSTAKWDVIHYAGRNGNGKERRLVKRFYSLQEAKLFAAKLTQLTSEGAPNPDPRITVQAYLERWLYEREPSQEHPDASPVSLTTWARHKDMCRLHV